MSEHISPGSKPRLFIPLNGLPPDKAIDIRLELGSLNVAYIHQKEISFIESFWELILSHYQEEYDFYMPLFSWQTPSSLRLQVQLVKKTDSAESSGDKIDGDGYENTSSVRDEET